MADEHDEDFNRNRCPAVTLRRLFHVPGTCGHYHRTGADAERCLLYHLNFRAEYYQAAAMTARNAITEFSHVSEAAHQRFETYIRAHRLARAAVLRLERAKRRFPEHVAPFTFTEEGNT